MIGVSIMRPIIITEDCIIYNDMPRGWVRGKFQPKWHESLYKRWVHMWQRCKNPMHKQYNNYKGCSIDDRYHLLSEYVHDIKLLEDFDLLKENPSKYDIDKDKKDPNNRCYYFEHLQIITSKDNRLESFARNGNPNPPKPIIGISLSSKNIILCLCGNDVKKKGFDASAVHQRCKGRHKRRYKGYKWYHLNYKYNKTFRRV